MSYKNKVPSDILIIMVLVILTAIFILIPPFDSTWVRTVLGLPMVLFFPGYALIAALFPKKDDLDGIVRVALSFGLSIAVVPLLGLGLNYTPWGIRLVPILITLSIFTSGMCAIAIYRHSKLPEGEVFSVPFKMECETPPQEAPTLTEKLANNQKILLMLPVMLIISAELLLFSDRIQYAIWLHVLVLVGLTLATIYTCETGLFKPYQALMLLPILRLINISMPIFFETTLYSYIFIYAPLAIPVYIVAVQQGFTFEQLGFNMMYWKWIIPVSLIVGFAIAQGEYYIIRPGYLIPDLSFWNLFALSIVMILFIGLIEELIFRSILQIRLQESMGMFSGLIVTSILFGVLHSGYGTFYEMLFTSLAGLAIGIMFQKTRSLPLIALTHGLVNIFLFGVIPLMGPTLGL